MPKHSKNRVAGRHFTWNLFVRDGICYADGRHNKPNVGKHSLGTPDRHEALRLLHLLDERKAVELGRVQPRRDAGDAVEVTIADGWERYLAHVARPGVLDGATVKTVQRYRAVRDKHVPHCTRRRLMHWGQIDKAALKDYVTWLSTNKYADNTAYMEGTLIKQVVIWLIEEEKALPESNRIRLKLKRSEISDTYCYTRDQVRAMVDLCRTKSELHWLADVLVALALTGMRIGELAALRWSDIDPAREVITLSDNRHSGRARKAGAVRTTKGRRSRRVDVHERLREVLLRLPHSAEGGHVFRGLQGGALDPDKVLKVLKRDVITHLTGRFPTPEGEIGFQHGGVHSFRHYFVTEAFLGGATDGEVRDWVGHRDSRIVERYRHLRGQASKQTMARLNFLGGDVTAADCSPHRNTTDSGGANRKPQNVGHPKENNSRGTDGPNGSAPQ
ncbi:MAG TPA: tyrosine-type recombinase/integrase [Tepidisphaeraceae bacterium]|jgi:integrase|nr:tyrosine-type recombinase/integrase [Tepidisphaeraceae bacterium]